MSTPISVSYLSASLEAAALFSMRGDGTGTTVWPRSAFGQPRWAFYGGSSTRADSSTRPKVFRYKLVAKCHVLTGDGVKEVGVLWEICCLLLHSRCPTLCWCLGLINTMFRVWEYSLSTSCRDVLDQFVIGILPLKLFVNPRTVRTCGPLLVPRCGRIS